MLIVCPACANRYELDAAKLGPLGRKVRCAGCQTLWHVDAPLEAVAFPEAPSSDETTALLDEELRRAAAPEQPLAVEPAEEPAAAPLPRPRPRKGAKRRLSPSAAFAAQLGGLRVPAALTAAGLAVLGLLAWQRHVAVRVAPQLAFVFETLGLPVNLRGLSLTRIESAVVEDQEGRFLVVEGDVTNIARGRTKVPPIEIAVRDAAGQTLYSWTTDPPRDRLEPSELVHFRARLATPPESGRSVQVRFAGEAPTGVASAR